MTRLPPLPSGRPKRPWRLLLAGVLVLAILAGGLWRFRQRGRDRDLTPYVTTAERGVLPGVVTASGELEAIRRVNVSPKRAGRLDSVTVEEGDTVRRGQVIGRMDDGDLRDRIQEAQALVRQARAEADSSASELARRRRLLDQGAISVDSFSAFRTRSLTSEDAYRAAQERLDQRRIEAGELVIRAPFDGVVTARYADPGAFVTPTTTASATAGATSSSIVELAQGLEVVAQVPESDIGRLAVGQDASVRVDSFPDQRFPARVHRIAPRAIKTNNVTSFEVTLRLVGPAPDLRIGMTADIDFSTGDLPARTLVPTVAVVTEEGTPGVLVVDGNDEPRFQPVDLGPSSGAMTSILSGLEPGSRIFIDRPPWVRDGDD
ncbi:efflux RND transporter periplasmic adaptor subunit [Synechococcus sp. RSCCF101]|uniref:efflux RND transporter periplasmic adaptor subunit n=1 Tax=Synechococcus sp. RSCCF101 TaxID=2511069 RepID=UPI001248EC02|nr:efflux RND transporter periplasmic adaptor subunit [Synechococcus sp. RSCCF101]